MSLKISQHLKALCLGSILLTSFASSGIESEGLSAKNTSSGGAQNVELARHDFPYPSNYVEVHGSKMHYVDTGGEGSVVLMLHGQPTWSYLWRDVIPELEAGHRVIALDLIGFGKSDKPDISYTVEEHAKYLKGFIDALKLRDMTMVIHDWGSFLGFDYAADNPDKVKALAFLESFVPGKVQEPEGSVNRRLMDNFYTLVQQFKTPGVGEKMILEDNFFIEEILLKNQGMTEDEKNAYREPFTKGKNRLPMLQFPRQISFDGISPEYVVSGQKHISEYLTTTQVPKLLMTFTPGALVGAARAEWAEHNLPNIQVQHIGEGVHFVQEVHGKAIGETIDTWMLKNHL